MALFVLIIQNILFIINPLSHSAKKGNIEKEIKKNLDLKHYNYDIVYTQHPKHATELAHKAIGSYDIVAAIGGDGTVNEVAKGLMGSDVSLAIIPTGSGNGLARHLEIPVDVEKALKTLNHSEPLLIDVGMVNNHPFFVAAGVGFDAKIAEKFSTFGRRGFLSYLQITLEEYLDYQPSTYYLEIDSQPFIRKAMMVSIANASQFGNDVIIAPAAQVNDGYLDLVILKQFPFYAAPDVFLHLIQGKFNECSHVETFRCKQVSIKNRCSNAHLDGEPFTFNADLTFAIKPKYLKVMAPKSSSTPIPLNK